MCPSSAERADKALTKRPRSRRTGIKQNHFNGKSQLKVVAGHNLSFGRIEFTSRPLLPRTDSSPQILPVAFAIQPVWVWAASDQITKLNGKSFVWMEIQENRFGRLRLPLPSQNLESILPTHTRQKHQPLTNVACMLSLAVPA